MNPAEKHQPSTLMEAFVFIELVYFTTIREVRSASGNAALGLLMAVSRIMVMVLIFYMLFNVIGMRSAPIRGDVILFLVGGVLLFFMHNAAVGKVLAAGSSISAMMQHAPMTPPLMIIAGIISVLYLHVFAICIIFTGIYVFKGELEIYKPEAAILPFILAWASGVGMGLIFLMLRPIAPNLMKMIGQVYQRANLVTSGKFFLANMLPNFTLPFFLWNPLFHSIDQMRGAIFVNYVPHKTNLEYPITFVIVSIVVGMMGEFWMRRTVSRSSAATR